MATLRETSKQNYACTGTTADQINAGSLQRIADSLEKMEQPYLQLLRDNEFLNRRYKEQQADLQRMAKRIWAYQGVITKMKKKASCN
jgi:hypothetical protein